MSCRECSFKVSDNDDCIACDTCNSWYHYSCANLHLNEFLAHCENENMPWKCYFCILNTHCEKCKLISTPKKKTIFCQLCNKIFHIKCVGITVPSYNNLCETDKTWYCRSCNEINIPFHAIDNRSLLKCFEIKVKKDVPIKTPNIHINCSCCSKNVMVNHRKIYCSTCSHYIHQKCSFLKPKDLQILNLDTWECLNCRKEKFPFINIENDELLMFGFNSNLKCSCSTRNINSIPNNLNLLLTSHSDEDFQNSENLNENYVDLKPDFKYYEVHDFHKMIDKIDSKKQSSLLHTNICSLQANIEKLEILLYDLSYKFDVIALTETWNPENKDHVFSAKDIEGYNSYIATTGTTSKSGVGLYINNDLISQHRNDLDFKAYTNTEEFESTWIEIHNNTHNPNTIAGVIYRHPSETDEGFRDALKQLFKKLKKEKKKNIIISGDFNYDLLKYENDIKVSRFLNLMLENNFNLTIREPTRIVDTNKPSLLDNIFINKINEPTSGNILEKISYDHLPNFIIFDSELSRDKSKKIKTRDMKNFDEENFTRELNNLNLDIDHNLASNIYFNHIQKNFTCTLNKHAPIKYLNKRETKIRQKPWLTRGILVSIKEKRRLFAQFKKTNNSVYYEKYKIKRDLLNKLCRKSKKMHYRNYVLSNVNNIKKSGKKSIRF